MPDATLADAVVGRLSHHLGPNVAKMAIKGFVKKTGLTAPEQLTSQHVPALVEEIRPMLNVMIGKAQTEIVLAEIRRAAGL